MRRLLPVLAVALGSVLAADAHAADGQYWCGTHAPPCIASATRDGVTVTPSNPKPVTIPAHPK